MTGGAPVSDMAAELRALFDAGFAEAPAEAMEPPVPFLRIGVAGQRYLVALEELSGVFADRPVTAIPAGADELAGIAALHGEVVPVFSLAALLGRRAGDSAPRWLLLARGDDRIGLAAEALEGHVRIPRADIAPMQQSQGTGPCHANGLVDGVPCPIIRVATLVTELKGRMAGNTSRGRD